MKKVLLLMFLSVALAACSGKSLKLEITNPSSLDKNNEMVETCPDMIREKLALAQNEKFIILDEAGKQVVYQLVTKGTETIQSVIFPVSVKAEGKVIYTIKKGKPETFVSKVFGRQVPERKDDFAWENDRISFRMYGPALAKENPSNGVDIWLKNTEELVVDQFYRDELEKGLSYHVDHGKGLDCYKVGHTLGAGGISPYVDNKLWVGNHYDSYKILDNGPLRITFELTYDSIPVADKKIKQTVQISLDAYSQLNKAEVSCEGDFDTIQLAGGIFLHKVLGDIKTDIESGYIAYAENAISDAGLASGRDYIAVVLPGMTNVVQDETHLLALAGYKKGDKLTYYFGAGWNKWGFETDDAWFKYVSDYATSLKDPLKVNILEGK